MAILGYFGALLTGLVLGLIGGGGAILLVPVLVFLFHVVPELATAYSLFIISITSLVGAYSHFKLNNIDTRAVAFFGIPSVIAIIITRYFIMPSVPVHIVSLGAFEITKPIAILLLFACLMLLVAYNMIKPAAAQKPPEPANDGITILAGIGVGILSGILGTGAGVIIVPSLVFLAGLAMKRAVGTSLTIITVNAMAGFVASLIQAYKHNTTVNMDWPLLLSLLALTIAGIVIGSRLSSRISNEKLKPAFGWFVLFMGIYIIVDQIIKITATHI